MSTRPLTIRRRAARSDFWLAYEAAFPQRTHCFCGKEEGETNHAKRFFGTVRARLSRLVRRSCSFSKSIERHLEVIHLFITSYNLEIQHNSMVTLSRNPLNVESEALLDEFETLPSNEIIGVAFSKAFGDRCFLRSP